MPVFGANNIQSAEYVDEGSVTFGAVSPRASRIRAWLKKKALARKLATQKRLQALKIKKQQQKLKQIKKVQAKKVVSKKIDKKFKNKRANLYAQALEQDSMGYEYSGIHGSPYSGFADEGECLKGNFTHYHGNSEDVKDFGMIVGSGLDDSLGYSDQGFEGWKVKIKRPKIRVKVKAPKSFKAAIKDVGKVAAKVATAPHKLAVSAIKATPIAKDVWKGVDKVTGGTLSKLDRIADLPNKVAAGKPISKAELMEVAMTAIQVAAIVASGGSAAALISAGAGMLKGGPLGQTNFGRNILTLAEVAGAGAAIHQAATAQAAKQAATESSKELAKQAASEATKTATKEVAKKTMLDSAKEAVKARVMDTAKQAAMKEVQKKTGIPVNLAMAAYDVNKMNASIADKAKVFSKKFGEEQLKKAGLSSNMSQAILSGNAQALGVMIKDAPNLAIDKAKREYEAQKIKLIESVNIEKLKKKTEEKLAKATDRNKILQQLEEKITKEANSAVKKQLEKLMLSHSKQYVEENQEFYASAQELEIAKAQGSLKVAAAEEGRYDSSMGNFSHPLLKWSKGFA